MGPRGEEEHPRAIGALRQRQELRLDRRNTASQLLAVPKAMPGSRRLLLSDRGLRQALPRVGGGLDLTG